MDMIDDVAFRVKDPRFEKMNYADFILRSMNRVYRQVNRDTMAVEKVLPIPAGSFSEEEDSFAMPGDMIRPFRIEPVWTYRDPGIFVRSGDEGPATPRTFTMSQGKFIFANVNESSAFEIWYYSSGNTLVNKLTDNLEEGEINSPEWPYEGSDQLLFYGTCIEVTKDYPMFGEDREKFLKLKSDLIDLVNNRQGVTPNISGWGPPSYRDDYGERF